MDSVAKKYFNEERSIRKWFSYTAINETKTEVMQPHISFKPSMQKRPWEVRPIQKIPQDIFMTVENYKAYSCFIHENYKRPLNSVPVP